MRDACSVVRSRALDCSLRTRWCGRFQRIEREMQARTEKATTRVGGGGGGGPKDTKMKVADARAVYNFIWSSLFFFCLDEASDHLTMRLE